MMCIFPNFEPVHCFVSGSNYCFLKHWGAVMLSGVQLKLIFTKYLFMPDFLPSDVLCMCIIQSIPGMPVCGSNIRGCPCFFLPVFPQIHEPVVQSRVFFFLQDATYLWSWNQFQHLKKTKVEQNMYQNILYVIRMSIVLWNIFHVCITEAHPHTYIHIYLRGVAEGKKFREY